MIPFSRENQEANNIMIQKIVMWFLGVVVTFGGVLFESALNSAKEEIVFMRGEIAALQTQAAGQEASSKEIKENFIQRLVRIEGTVDRIETTQKYIVAH